MDKKRRAPKKTDQQIAEKAFQIIKKTMQEHSEIEPTIWAAGCWSVIVDGYIKCGFSYEEFGNELNSVKDYYKSWWDEE